MFESGAEMPINTPCFCISASIIAYCAKKFQLFFTLNLHKSLFCFYKSKNICYNDMVLKVKDKKRTDSFAFWKRKSPPFGVIP